MRKKNTISQIQTKIGQVLDSFEQIKEVTTQYFEYLYTQDNVEGDEFNDQVG